MVELEVQTLSLTREGLLIDVGRSVTESGFTLQRQRLTQDSNGALLSMIVRGPPRKQRVLEAALDANERIISFDITEAVAGELRPHFAAARKPSAYVPPPAPAAEPETVSAAAQAAGPAPKPAPPWAEKPAFDGIPIRHPEARIELPATMPAPAPVPAAPPAMATASIADLQQELARELERMMPPPMAEAARPAPEPALEPFVEIAVLPPDIPAVEALVNTLPSTFPQIIGAVQALDRAVPPGAREPSLELAGRQAGAWLAAHRHAEALGHDLSGAIERVALPALEAFVEVERSGDQLHIRQSPLCSGPGHSGCSFYSGFLQGLLEPVIGNIVIFPVCCRSFGADDCVLALSG